jgi:tetratricopeptide (TPR) repeat protein
MAFHDQQIAPPKAWDKFEDLCWALFCAEWGDGNAQKNGRQGQAQAGVDVFGHNHAQGGGLWGVQCKLKHSATGSKLSQPEIEAELAKADSFEPKLDHWIMATTSPNDAALQTWARKHSATRTNSGLCPVTLYFWDSIEQLMFAHPAVAERFYPEHFAHFGHFGQRNQPLHLPALSLSAYFSDPVGHLPRLRQQLQQSGSSALLAAATVQGMGGVGKTQLALKYCLTFQDQYHGVWWLQAETANLLEQECVLFCAKQGLMLPAGESPIKAMSDWLARQQQHWLLVFDNVEDAKLVRAILPKGGAHHVLITSRLRAGWAGMAKVELDVWQEEQALPFLRDRLAGVVTAGVVGNDDAPLRLLSQTLGGLPLALEQACAYIATHQVTIGAYCQRIQAFDSETRLLDRNDSEFCPRSVLATLSLALEKLSDAAKELLGVCAWLAAEPIPEYLFTEPPPEGIADAAAKAVPPALRQATRDEFTWRETVAELENYELCHARVERMTDHIGNGAEQVRCLHFHRLTQTALRASADSAGGAALLLVLAAFPFAADYPAQWPRCRSLVVHVLRLHEAYQPSWKQAACYAALLNQLAIYLRHGPALYPQAITWQRHALQIQQSALGEEHPQTLILSGNLATTLYQMGDFTGARLLQENVLNIWSSVYGEDHPDTLISINNLALTLAASADLIGAKRLHEKALRIRRKVFGNKHPDTAQSINNLALTLTQMGDLRSARALHEIGLEIYRQTLGDEHPDTLQIINNLAATLIQMGDLPGGRGLLETVLEIRHRVLGADHPDTLNSMSHLAMVRADLGDLPAAQDLLQQVVTTLERVLGDAHPYTKISKQNLATLIALQRRTAT